MCLLPSRSLCGLYTAGRKGGTGSWEELALYGEPQRKLFQRWANQLLCLEPLRKGEFTQHPCRGAESLWCSSLSRGLSEGKALGKGWFFSSITTFPALMPHHHVLALIFKQELKIQWNYSLHLDPAFQNSWLTPRLVPQHPRASHY